MIIGFFFREEERAPKFEKYEDGETQTQYVLDMSLP